MPLSVCISPTRNHPRDISPETRNAYRKADPKAQLPCKLHALSTLTNSLTYLESDLGRSAPGPVWNHI